VWPCCSVENKNFHGNRILAFRFVHAIPQVFISAYFQS
jgi:hypothetical protein